MNYTDSYYALKNIFSPPFINKSIDTIELHEEPFNSNSHKILLGKKEYYCDVHQEILKPNFHFFNKIGTIKDNVYIKDTYVEENQRFNYQIVKPKGIKKADKATILLHGFNEKDWYKYLPWAKAISEGTDSAVILFPIAFHMQRAPQLWSGKREMYKLSEDRKSRFPNIVNSTLSNVAISMRLHAMPQRFIWSGLQSYYDIIQWIEDCKKGNNPHIEKNFEFNMFGYSIGGFLSQILKLTNYNNYFNHAKVCLFCSGATFNRYSPVSKFILDSEANVALYSFLVEHFDKILQKDNLLHHYIKEDHFEGKVFSSMLDYQKMMDFRQSLLKKYENQLYAIALKKDEVIPPFEISNTLKGAYRNINITVDELDFDFDYTHENPFPMDNSKSKKVDKNFKLMFKKVCDFFNK
ncbi:hypothetical protein EGM88_06025 [Aureibaculum marinum]|uniref:Alpha/beta hydrolase n=1 Tax=Aureibaculum marinum TaxID=2487930 RepID=A0A3N4NSP9_9FLAO|nr:DUF6051 family protein [Aureibaculum marinum]RPD98745.1 hypothetical protein EGM88_06025 [Aureibaculum marinum]